MVQKTTDWIVTQIGARMDYAVVRSLNNIGLLSALYTDMKRIPRWLALLIPPSKQVKMSRRGIEVPFRQWLFFGFCYQICLKLFRDYKINTCIQILGKSVFDRLVSASIEEKHLYSYNLASVHQFRKLHRAFPGGKRILEQTIAPLIYEVDVLQQNGVYFNGLQKLIVDYGIKREKEEWSLATHIVCGSTFVRDVLVDKGVRKDKIQVIPYGADFTENEAKHEEQVSDKKVILFTGRLSVRKGFHTLMDLVDNYAGKVTFQFVGGVSLTKKQLRKLKNKGVILVPSVTKDVLRGYYESADIYVFPSLCEGSATVIYEAMSVGLPVVCSYSSGSVIRSGYDGYVCTDFKEYIKSIDELLENDQLRKTIAENARNSASGFTRTMYEKRIGEFLSGIN